MIEVVVRAIMYDKEGRILFAKYKEKDYYFLPGGHMEYGETVERALKRELQEELALEIQGMSFAGAMENLYREEGRRHHEMFLVFDVKAENVHDKSNEDNLDFFFLTKKEIQEKNVVPAPLRKILSQRSQGEIIWGSENNNFR